MNLEKAARIAVKSLTPNKPYHVQWLITRKCNYRCRSCNVWRLQDTKELSTEQIKKGMDILREMGVVEIVLSGGNPLLRNDIGEIIEYASRYFVTTVYDNGSMAADRIQDLKKADFVALSIDSIDPKKNDYVRGVAGACQRTIETAEKLHREGISVSVSPTISGLNLNEIVDFTSFFLSRDIPIWYCVYSYDTCDQSQLFKIGRKSDEFAITDRKAMVSLCDSISRMKDESNGILMTRQILEALKQLYLTGKRTWKCRALRNFFVIDHLGRVGGCHVHEPVTTLDGLADNWKSKKFDELRMTYEQCSQCTYMCYIFYSLHGSVFGNLQIAQAQWKNAGLLIRKSDFRSPNLARKK